MEAYALDISLKHRVALGESDPYSEIIQEYEAAIIHRQGESETVAGTFDFYVANVGLAVNSGVDIVDVVDSLEEDIYQYCNALFEPGTRSEVREDVVEQFEYPMGNRVLMLHLAKVLPEHRSRRLGLVAAQKIIQQFGDGLVVAKAQPLQHHSGFNEEKEMSYGTFEQQRDVALKRLTRHWQRLGFKPIGDTGYLGLNTAYKLPVPRLVITKRVSKRPAKAPPKPARRRT
jgi:hypothetical protein|nr:hypothetical protein [Kofleriaceae bacterium]